MLSFCRRAVSALLAVALTAQLVQAQLVLCGQMDMSESAMMTDDSMNRMMQGQNADPRTTLAGPNQEERTDPSADPKCVIPAACLTTPAVPSLPPASLEIHTGPVSMPSEMLPPRAVSFGPDLPPPRS